MVSYVFNVIIITTNTIFFFFFFPGNSINQAGSKIHLLQIDGNKWKIDSDHKCKQKKNAEFPNVKRSIYLELVD